MFNFFLSQYIGMKMRAQTSIVLKCNMKNLMTSLLPMVEKIISNKLHQIKSDIMQKISPNKLKKRQNTPKRVSNRGIKSLKNNFSVNTAKNIISTPKIVNEKPQIVTELKVVTSSKIAFKVKNVSKPKIIDKSEIVIEKENTPITMNIKIV